jgi:hypothetical protein
VAKTILAELAAKADMSEARAICHAIQECQDADHGISGSLWQRDFFYVISSDGGESPGRALEWAALKVAAYIPTGLNNIPPAAPAVIGAIEGWKRKWGLG